MTSYSKSNKMKLVIQLKPSKDVAGWKMSSPINPKQVYTPQSKKNWVTPILGIFSSSPAVRFQGCNLAK